jgi:hypothetical protein
MVAHVRPPALPANSEFFRLCKDLYNPSKAPGSWSDEGYSKMPCNSAVAVIVSSPGAAVTNVRTAGDH